jgi:hypothetical protein
MEHMSEHRQLLHLVIGGELKDLDRPEFIDLKRGRFRRRLSELSRRLRRLEGRGPTHRR